MKTFLEYLTEARVNRVKQKTEELYKKALQFKGNMRDGMLSGVIKFKQNEFGFEVKHFERFPKTIRTVTKNDIIYKPKIVNDILDKISKEFAKKIEIGEIGNIKSPKRLDNGQYLHRIDYDEVKDDMHYYYYATVNTRPNSDKYIDGYEIFHHVFIKKI